MYRLLVLLSFACATLCLAQTSLIKSGATVYVEPMDGYETYLAAAISKKKVPLIVVAERSRAEYIITSTMSHQAQNQPAVVVNNTNINGTGENTGFQEGMQRAAERRAARGWTSASISVIDAQSSRIVFAYAVGKSANSNQVQSTAEACAKHLKEFIEKSSR